MVRFFVNRWFFSSLAVLIAGIGGGAVALGEPVLFVLFGAAFLYDEFVYDKATGNPMFAGIFRRGKVLEVGNNVSGSG